MYILQKIFLLLILVLGTLNTIAQDHVTLKDGEVIEGRIIETKLHNSIGVLANISVNGEKIKITKIRSYFKGDKYMVNIGDQFFLKAKLHGKINVIHIDITSRDFSRMSTSGSVAVSTEKYLLQKAEDGKLEGITYKNLEEMILDNPEVLAYYKTIEKKKDGYYGTKKQDAFLASIIEIVEMYNKK